jgi:hypothetical protein
MYELSDSGTLVQSYSLVLTGLKECVPQQLDSEVMLQNILH